MNRDMNFLFLVICLLRLILIAIPFCLALNRAQGRGRRVSCSPYDADAYQSGFVLCHEKPC